MADNPAKEKTITVPIVGPAFDRVMTRPQEKRTVSLKKSTDYAPGHGPA